MEGGTEKKGERGNKKRKITIKEAKKEKQKKTQNNITKNQKKKKTIQGSLRNNI